MSAISFWEIAMLQDTGRLTLLHDTRHWRRELLQQGLVELPIDGDTGIRAAGLEGFHGDAADRLIVATAMAGRRLATADRRILGWRGPLHLLDARE